MSYKAFMSHANIKKIDEDWKIIKKKLLKIIFLSKIKK